MIMRKWECDSEVRVSYGTSEKKKEKLGKTAQEKERKKKRIQSYRPKCGEKQIFLFSLFDIPNFPNLLLLFFRVFFFFFGKAVVWIFLFVIKQKNELCLVSNFLVLWKILNSFSSKFSIQINLKKTRKKVMCFDVLRQVFKWIDICKKLIKYL